MNITAPKPGYWRSSPTLETFSECILPESCLGGNSTNPLGSCASGYRGILCNDCEWGYSRKGGTECSECPAIQWNVIQFGLLLTTLVLLVLFLVRATLLSVHTKRPLYQVFLKIFLNHFQLLAAVAQIDFKWPPMIQEIISAQKVIAEIPIRMLSVDCLMMDIFPNEESSLRLNYVRLILFTLMPFIIAIISSLFWCCWGRLKHTHPKIRGDKSTATTIIVLFLFYPSIVSIIAKSVNCIKVEDTYRLFDDLEEECFTGTHLLIFLTVSLPALTAWAAGIPVFAMFKLVTNLKFLAYIKSLST